jgi:phosphatidylcholine synthase
MGGPDISKRPHLSRRASAFAVHVLTAAGAALALLALFAAVERQWALMFAWLGVALIVDAVDGSIARMLNVRVLAARWSGDVLDLVVDILTYVFVPAYALATGGILPSMLAVPLSLLVVITGALYFADQRMKSADNYFIGFPAIWNLAAFYLFVLRPDPWIAAPIVLALCVLTFVPLPFVHPFRVVRLRWVSMAVLAVGLVLGVVTLMRGMQPGALMTAGLCAVALYFVVIGLSRPRTDS